MADKSSIEWTDATWNPVTGCTKISAGCDNCYAERFSERFRGVPGHPFENGFDLTLRPERLEQPLALAQAAHDLRQFDERPLPQGCAERIHRARLRHDGEGALAHVPGADEALVADAQLPAEPLRDRRARRISGVGVSVEDGTQSFRVCGILQQAPAGVRFLSIEPLIGPIGKLNLDGIDWVIVGGESGPSARPMEPQWVRSIRDQCKAAGVAFFFKQWGGRGRRSGGRKLDGREWNQFPKPPALYAMAAE